MAPIRAEYLAEGYDLKGKMETPKLQGGYSYPLTPSGKGNVLGEPPYHFCGEELVVVYQADPEAVKQFLPYPFEPSLENPGGCVIHFNSYESIVERDKELLYELPDQCLFTEAYIEVRCRFKGKETKIYSYFWVNKDYSLLRGWIMGAPKKIGVVHTSFEKHHMNDLNPHFPQFGEGFKIGAICSAHMEKLIHSVATLDKPIHPDDMHPDVLIPTHNILHYPDLKMGYKGPLVHKVIHGVMDTWYGDCWECTDIKLDFFDSVAEEHQLLKPVEITASYFTPLGFTIYGHVVDYDFNEENK
jgi:hypothetical protein